MAKKQKILHPPAEQVTQLQVLVEQLRLAHHNLYDHISQLGDKLKLAGSFDNQDLTDIGFLLRAAEERCEETRKDVKARKDIANKTLCEALISEYTQRPDLATGGSEGTLATGTPDVKYQVNPPDPDKPGSAAFYKWLGFENSAKYGGLVKVSWTEMTKLITGLLEAGSPLPPGIDKPWPVHNMIYRRKSRAVHDSK